MYYVSLRKFKEFEDGLGFLLGRDIEIFKKESIEFSNAFDAIAYAKEKMQVSSFVMISNYDECFLEQLEIAETGVLFKTALFKMTELVDFYNSLVKSKNVIYSKVRISSYTSNNKEFFIDIPNSSKVDNDFLNNTVYIDIAAFKAKEKLFHLYLYADDNNSDNSDNFNNFNNSDNFNNSNNSEFCCEDAIMANWKGAFILCTTVELTPDVLTIYKYCGYYKSEV